MSGATRQAVLEQLIREADLDGLVTVAEREIGDAIGVSSMTVSTCIHNLAADGLLTILTAASGYKNMNAIQLSESVLS